MISKLKAVLDDDRGVSPVIGVILMVAITVILAAVIGTFVLGLGDSLEQAPQAQLDVTSDADEELTLSHSGGDALTVSEIEVDIGSEAGQNIDDNSDDFDGDEFGVGDSATFTDTSISGTMPTGDNIEITVIHTPSDSILLNEEIDINAA